MSRSAHVARNVGWSLIGQVGIAVSSFVLTPRLVHGFGVEGYGLYVLMFAAVNYIQILTFGAGGATVRFAAERRSAGDGKGVRDVLRYGAILHVGGAMIGAAVLWFAAPWAASSFFQIPPQLFVPGVAILRAAAVGAVFYSGVQWVQACLQGIQRFEWNSVSSMLQGILMPLGVAVLLANGKGLRAAGLWYVAVSALTFAVSLIVLWEAMPDEAHYQREEGLSFRKFSLYGLGMWLGPIAWIVGNQFDKVFIVRYLALSSLTVYAVPTGLLQRLQMVPASISSVLFPVISEARGEGVAEDLRRMYIRSTRMLLGIMAPVYLLMFSLMPQFLSLWLGGRFGIDGVWPARLLVAANAAGLLNFTANAVAAGRGKVWWLSAVAWGQAFGSLILWPLLIPRFGILGAAMATLAAQVLPDLVYLHRVNRLLDLPWKRFAPEALMPALLAGAALLVVVFPLHHLVDGWVSFIVLSSLGGAIYAATLWLNLPHVDRHFILRWAGRV